MNTVHIWKLEENVKLFFFFSEKFWENRNGETRWHISSFGIEEDWIKNHYGRNDFFSVIGFQYFEVGRVEKYIGELRFWDVTPSHTSIITSVLCPILNI